MHKAEVRIVGISGLTLDYAQLIAEVLQQRGFRCEASSFPFLPVGSFTPSTLRALKRELANGSPETVTVFCSGSAEYYLPGPHLSVHFSAYRGWFNPRRMRVIAHPWTEAEPGSIDRLMWTDKPPLAVGFMGTAYSSSRVARMLSRSAASRLLLSGSHLRHANLLAGLNAAKVPLKYAMTFPRPQTLRAVRTEDSRRMDLQVVDTGGFSGLPEDVARYEKHMLDVTYVLCPRGIENYSLRFYEALKFGRVPVLIDTGIVLPEEADWDELIVRVPYTQLDRVREFIAYDYEKNSGEAFRRRQLKAVEVMARLCAGGWADGLVDDIRKQLPELVAAGVNGSK